MKKTTLLFPKGKKKALTFSYDDGVTQDIRLAKIFNENGLKCTFNINASKAISPMEYTDRGVTVRNIPKAEYAEVYNGHEIATHSFTHPFLTKMHDKEIFEEISRDRLELEKITGGLVRGHAYPYGAYNDNVISALKNNFIVYARTVASTMRFDFPQNFHEWHPTCHHKSPNLTSLLDSFITGRYPSSLFYVWGHSYEFDMDDNWDMMEEFCKKAGGHDDIWYATNIEIYDYICAHKNLLFSADASKIYNPTATDIYLDVDGSEVVVASGKTTTI